MQEVGRNTMPHEGSTPRAGRGETRAQKAPVGGVETKGIRIPPASVISGLAGIIGIALLLTPFFVGKYPSMTEFSVSGLELATGSGHLHLYGGFYIPFTATEVSPGAWFIVVGAAIAVTAMILVVLATSRARNAGARASSASRRSFGDFVRAWSGVFKLSGVIIILGAFIALFQILMLVKYPSSGGFNIVLPGFGLVGELCLGIVILEQGSEVSDYAKKWL